MPHGCLQGPEETERDAGLPNLLHPAASPIMLKGLAEGRLSSIERGDGVLASLAELCARAYDVSHRDRDARLRQGTEREVRLEVFERTSEDLLSVVTEIFRLKGAEREVISRGRSDKRNEAATYQSSWCGRTRNMSPRQALVDPSILRRKS